MDAKIEQYPLVEPCSPMCQLCKGFLRDFLEIHLPQDLPLSKQIRMKSLPHVHSELVDWMFHVYTRLPKQEFEKAVETASRIARRGRPLLDYEYLIQTATFNFLKVSVGWINQEMNYIQPLLVECGFVKSKQKQGDMNTATNYLSYMTPRVIHLLNDLHNDHQYPKGLNTNLTHLNLRPPLQEDEQTCYDRDDDYQKEILDEIDLSDLYT
jgi:hypothetical protein